MDFIELIGGVNRWRWRGCSPLHLGMFCKEVRSPAVSFVSLISLGLCGVFPRLEKYRAGVAAATSIVEIFFGVFGMIESDVVFHVDLDLMRSSNLEVSFCWWQMPRVRQPTHWMFKG